MADYETQTPSDEDIKTYHQKFPVAVKKDGEIIAFFINAEAAQTAIDRERTFKEVEEKLKQFVREEADARVLPEGEVWGIVHEASEGLPRDA
jgi:hypothetical protein